MPGKNVVPEGEMGTNPELGDIGADGESLSPEEAGLMESGSGVGPKLESPHPPRRGDQLKLPFYDSEEDQSGVFMDRRHRG